MINRWPRRGSYGIDAPLILFSALAVMIGNLGYALLSRKAAGLYAAAIVAPFIGIWIHTTWRGKFVAWSTELRRLSMSGQERVLDLGCGRGAVLFLAAEHLQPGGQAVGIDLWNTTDQSGNSLEAAKRNAIAEGVDSVVELHTGDMTALPFPNASFDLICSNVAIHNIKSVIGRDQAIAEAYRVTREGGRLRLADISHASRYRDQLTRLGADEIELRSLGWRAWWGGPWMPTVLVCARKPAQNQTA